MDAVDFIKELKRMHKKYFNPHDSTDHCGSCPLKSKECEKVSLMDESTVQKVEEWSNANPRLKRRDILLRIWPNATPEKIPSCYITGECHGDRNCEKCRKNFWGEYVE